MICRLVLCILVAVALWWLYDQIPDLKFTLMG